MKSSKVFSIVVYVLVFVVLIGVVGMFAGYINKGQKSFYVQSGSKQIYSDQSNFVFRENACYYFDVKNSLGFTKKQIKDVDYSVKVELSAAALMNAGFDSYTFDNHLYKFSDDIDCSNLFILSQDGNRFRFMLDKNLTLTDILKFYHDSLDVKNVPDVDLYSDNFLNIVVVNNADNTSIRLGIVREVDNE